MDNEALDRWITSGRYSEIWIEVWCQNPDCETFADTPINVKQETEYGMATWTPEECPHCGGELDEGRPEAKACFVLYDDPGGEVWLVMEDGKELHFDRRADAEEFAANFPDAKVVVKRETLPGRFK